MGLAPPPGARIAVVGGCGGIGAAVVGALVEAGASVAVLDLSVSLAAAPPPAGVERIAFDGRVPAEIDAAFAQLAASWAKLDGLVLASGYAGVRKPLAEITQSEWDDVIAGNLSLAAGVLARGARLMGEGAAIVALTSDMAYAPQPGYGPYVAAKAGLVALCRALARELAPRVRVNLVSPGAVDTAFLRGGLGRTSAPDAPLRFDLAAYLAQVPLGRLAQAGDMVGPVLFLLGPASAYMTGEVLHVSGGAVMA